tara:strand:+ start:35476 stop:36810 length:1335 start_codon:yes stop_codon:yes gene_type:complete
MKSLSLLSILNCVVVIIFIGCKEQPNFKDIPKPNIIIILADDLGYGGIGCYGNTDIKTPHLDELAEKGIRFTDFHSNGSVCTPTRAALLTGQYQQRSGMEGVIYVKGETREVGLDTSRTTIADILGSNGYTTGIMGKWHLGYKKEYNPVHQGFDEFFGYVSGNVDYHSHYDNAAIYDWWHNLDSISEKGYVTDLITDHSIDFIDRNKDKPFFLYISHEAPHVPFQGRKDSAYRFPGEEFSYYGPVKDTAATYKEMVEVMDEGIGKVIQALRKNNLEKNTLVFFLSDNGAEKFGHNGGLNGEKISLLEGGHRIPAIAYWKDRIHEGVSSEILMTMDVMPTLASISGVEASEVKNLDGVDFSQALFENNPIERRTLFWRYRNQKAVRNGKWKLYIAKSDTALFDLQKDIRETNNLYKSETGVLRQLANELDEWESEMGSTAAMKTK